MVSLFCIGKTQQSKMYEITQLSFLAPWEPYECKLMSCLKRGVAPKGCGIQGDLNIDLSLNLGGQKFKTAITRLFLKLGARNFVCK